MEHHQVAFVAHEPHGGQNLPELDARQLVYDAGDGRVQRLANEGNVFEYRPASELDGRWADADVNPTSHVRIDCVGEVVREEHMRHSPQRQSSVDRACKRLHPAQPEVPQYLHAEDTDVRDAKDGVLEGRRHVLRLPRPPAHRSVHLVYRVHYVLRPRPALIERVVEAGRATLRRDCSLRAEVTQHDLALEGIGNRLVHQP